MRRPFTRHPELAPAALLLVLASAFQARADVPPAETAECAASQDLDRYQLLRRLSLDLRNALPSYEEYAALDATTEIPEGLVDDMLASDAFRMVMRRFHEGLLWPNVTTTQLTDTTRVIATTRVNGQNNDRYVSVAAARRKLHRQGSGNETCGDWLQTEFAADGKPVTNPVTAGGVTYQEDGYVLVHPYWDPTSEIKVCAFDAQPAATATLANGQTVDCATTRSATAQGCGCGPNLQWCYGPATSATVLGLMREQLGRLVDLHTVGGRPYSELLTTPTTFTNGALAFWKQNLAQMANVTKTYNERMTVDEPALANPSFVDTTWTEATRTGAHSGILTLPGYTLRFQTNRGRANRFRTVFTHQSFIPPATTTDTNCDPTAADLTQRCLCRSCHAVLEPLAAAFGGVAEAGSAVIAGSPLFPTYNKTCDPTTTQNQGKTMSAACQRFWVSDPAARNPGTLIPYQYADIDDPVHAQIAANLAAGPVGVAQDAIDKGLVHSAVVQHLFRFLMGRDVVLDPGDDANEIGLLESLTTEFRASDDIRQLTRAIVALPQYGRVR